MSLVIDGRRPVHFPEDGEKFEFDAEVSAIFDDMARRSIPMYRESHRIHAAMCYNEILDIYYHQNRKANVLDFGCSTGTFIDELCKRFQSEGKELWDHATVGVLDNSPHMLAQLAAKHPKAKLIEADALKVSFDPGIYDIINTSYLIQFLHPEKKFDVLHMLSSSLRTNGLFISSQKEWIGVEEGVWFDELYIDYRKANGYTQEEIDAKTKALKGAMWCCSYRDYRELLIAAGFINIQATVRWLHFNSLIARRSE